MTGEKGAAHRISYRHHKILVKIAYLVLIIVAGFTVVINLVLLHETHQTIIAKTDRHISELSASVSNSLAQRFQRTLRILESVELSYDQDGILSSSELERLHERADLLQFEYFAFISPDGSAVCSDGVSRTFSQQDGIMKVFEGQAVIDVEASKAEAGEQILNMPFFAIPIRSHGGTGEITGIFAAPVSPEQEDFYLVQSYYGGNVFFNLVKPDGTEIFITTRSHVLPVDEPQNSDKQHNLFDTLDANVEIISDTSVDDLREAAVSGRNATIRFHLPNSSSTQTGQLSPISDTGLCVWMVDTDDAVSEGIDQILHIAFRINGLGVVCFCLIITILLFLYRKNTRILMVDPVTGGYSLSRFTQEAERLVHHSNPGEYTLIVMNIVHFKYFNDTYGFDESNRILKYVHTAIQKYMEDGEILVRSGADDFNLLIRTSRNSNEVIIQKLELMVDEVNRFNKELLEKEWIMFRVGVYQITDTSLSVIHMSDRANIARKKPKIPVGDILYSCGFYEEEDLAQLQKESILVNKMNDALENHDFKMYLQPKVDISTGKIVAAEALIRWQNPDMGLVRPDEFIPLFERNGFIRKLDLYMFEQVCTCLRRWLDEGLQPVQISINLSRVHLANKDFLKPFIAVQEKYRIPPELLEFELLESALQEFPEALPEAVCQIHLAGYTCSLDDFGSGYSSLNNLESLDIDVVKLDREFLNTAHTEGDRGHIVIEELIHMARRLGITVCCEGVETVEQLAFLQKCHCDKGQGYLFSKPVEVSVFEEMLFGNSQIK